MVNNGNDVQFDIHSWKVAHYQNPTPMLNSSKLHTDSYFR